MQLWCIVQVLLTFSYIMLQSFLICISTKPFNIYIGEDNQVHYN